MDNSDKKPQIRFKGFTHLSADRQALGNWCVYVLECDNGSFYKGKTNNIKRRINEHINGRGAKYTKLHKPVKLVYLEYFDSESEALQKEKFLKSGFGREQLKKYLQGGFFE